MPELTHFDSEGAAIMVDVSNKDGTAREAVAEGKITMGAECYALLRGGNAQKGDVLGVARVAGIMAAKRCGSLIPLCHDLNLEKVSIDFALDDASHSATAICTVKTTGKTGAEMEALTGASIALLTIYDMLKAADRAMEITGLHLLKKSGGKSGDYDRGEVFARD